MTEPRISRPESWRREFVIKNRAHCHYCNRGGTVDVGPDDRPWHIDHKNPLVRGGEDKESNLALACKRCNLTKGAKPYEEFRAFARLAYWVPADWRASEFDLDRLMELYNTAMDDDAQDPKWRFNLKDYSIDFVNVDGDRQVMLRHEDDTGILGCPGPNWDRERARMELVVGMHRLLPVLIAEIRMLRSMEQEGTQKAA